MKPALIYLRNKEKTRIFKLVCGEACSYLYFVRSATQWQQIIPVLTNICSFFVSLCKLMSFSIKQNIVNFFHKLSFSCHITDFLTLPTFLFLKAYFKFDNPVFVVKSHPEPVQVCVHVFPLHDSCAVVGHPLSAFRGTNVNQRLLTWLYLKQPQPSRPSSPHCSAHPPSVRF